MNIDRMSKYSQPDASITAIRLSLVGFEESRSPKSGLKFGSTPLAAAQNGRRDHG